MKKFIILLLVLLLLAAFPLSFAAESTVHIRIEGISTTLYNGDIPLGDAETVADALHSLDLTITGLDTGYITSVNDDVAGKFGGWDGWLFTINGIEAAAGVNATAIKAGDSVLLYYGDPYGVGMQFPELSLDNDVLTLTSKDTTFDADFNPTTMINPIANAIVTWYVEDAAYTYTSDASGKVTLPESVRTAGSHRITVSKVAENGLPLVLRTDTILTIAPTVATTPIITTTIEPTTTATNSPQTGVSHNTAVITLSAAALLLLTTAVATKRSAQHTT